MFSQIKIIKLAYYLLALAIVCLGLYFYKSVLSYFVIAVLFSFLVNPLIVMIENLGTKRVYAILIFYIIFFTNLVLLGNILVPIITRQLHSLGAIIGDFLSSTEMESPQMPYLVQVQEYYDKLNYMFPFIDFDSINVRLMDWLNSMVAGIPNLLISYSQNVFRLFTYLLSVPIISFFLLKDHIMLRNKIYAMIPNKYFEITLIIFEKMNSTVGKYLRALIIQMIIIATLACTVLTFLGIKFGILIGIIVGVINVIPYIGPLVGIILGGLVVFFTGGSISLLLWTILGLYFVQICDNTLVYPLVMGKNTSIHPVVIILTVIAGGLTFGLLGMLCAVPTVFLTKTLMKVLYHNLKQFELI